VDEIELIIPDKKHKKQIERFKRDFLSTDSVMHGAGGLDKNDADTWLKECDDYRIGRNLPKDHVCSTQFIVIRKNDGKIVGVIQIRHSLTPLLRRIGGHIGYSVVSGERRKGYASEMLRIALAECRRLDISEVFVSCDADNIASCKVIKNNGGVFDSESEYEGKLLHMYRILN